MLHTQRSIDETLYEILAIVQAEICSDKRAGKMLFWDVRLSLICSLEVSTVLATEETDTVSTFGGIAKFFYIL